MLSFPDWAVPAVRHRRLVRATLTLTLSTLSLSVRAQEIPLANGEQSIGVAAPSVTPNQPPATQDSARELAYRTIANNVSSIVTAQDVPGGALAIIEGKRVRFVTGFGLKEDGGSAAVDADTRFRIGSITKTFTAALAMQLVAARVVSLDAPVTQYLPELQLQPPNDPRGLTLRRLLSHTGGVPDYVEFSCPPDEHKLSSWFADHPNLTLWTPPGRLYSYSSLGYSLAGLVLERAAGSPYHRLVEERILDPLALDSMTYDVSEALAGNHASGFSPGAATDPTSMACGLTEPPGYLWSSANDLARFASTLLRGGDHVLDARGLRLMQSKQTPTDPSGLSWYGLGLFEVTFRGVRVVGHNGAMPGYRSAMWLAPDRGLAVIILLNGDRVDPDPLAFGTIGALLGLPEEPPVDRTTPPSTWGGYTGVYDDEQAPTAFPTPWIGKVSVVLESEQLVIHYENGGRIPLQQVAGDVWLSLLSEQVVVPITFWRDRAGRVEYIATRTGALHRIGDLPQ
jgi:CubicO group peptidase (beta-lactamase class C family)